MLFRSSRIRTVYLRLLLEIIVYFGLTKIRITYDVAQNKRFFLLVFMQSFQLEGENDTETSDNKESDGQHVEHGDSAKSGLPDDSHRAKNGQNAKHQIPSPVLRAIAFQICGIATQCKPSEHQPKSDNKRNQLRSEERRVGKECRIGCRSRWSPYH